MKLWKPSTLKDKVIGIITVWFVFIIFASIYSDYQEVVGAAAIVAIILTIYILITRNYQVAGRGKVTQARLTYLGGGELSKEKELEVYISAKGLKYDKYFIPIEKIKAAHIETQSQVSSRLTVTRMVAFGIFALAAPKRKKTNEKYLSIEIDNNFSNTIIFGGKEVTKIHSALLRVKNEA